ncbi:TetR/AcrR family transcriptional regulator [Sphingomonas qomolangmaensis]|uniref:TetR/AcrR family transcriptional regulator n=1 Tax=Sphingomonas qomolangmaensis TaxID=2918765 RepID=A0ABY5L6E5_9SPHN|nr:TetR/AcrR family transcriptional regulator [Sphingomonas qomolangmaensis]UUL82347.1 TetR/AcrR family transcriptional regulator [Sphingomonas qomolangmaensis]
MAKPQTRRDQNREARRAAIVSAAREAFLEHGYAATSMSTIATQLGGSKGTLWAYFPSKEDLFAAVLDEVTSNFRQNLDDTLRPEREYHATLLDFAERFLRKMLDPDSIRLHRLIIGESGRFPEIGRLFYARGPQIVMERLSRYIAGRMEAGDLRSEDPLQAAMHLIQLIQTQQNLRLWGIIGIPEPDEIRVHAEKALDLFDRAYAT